ncbi:hypothetical protein ACP4OV_004144 [Aristida adscensionis]
MEASKATIVVGNEQVKADDKNPAAKGGSHEEAAASNAYLTRVETEKRMSLIKAWEENEKAKANNRAARRLASVTCWENSKIAQMEADLKKIHEQVEVEKAERAQKLRNKAAAVHRAAEEKRAAAEARRGAEAVRAGEAAARYRARGVAPATSALFGSPALFRRG